MKRRPKGKRGIVAVERLGRRYSTGNFAKLVKRLMAKGYSKKVATRIAAKVYWEKVRKR
jgi:hypothetical protein